MVKITFFDVLAFLLPGSIIICGLFMFNQICPIYNIPNADANSFFFQCVLLMFSYIVGIAIHTVSEIFEDRYDGKNSPLWKLKWVTKEFKKLKPEKRELIQQKLNEQEIGCDTEKFQTYYYSRMFIEAAKTKQQELSTMQTQSVMLRNACIAFAILFILSMLVIAFHFSWCSILKYALPLLVCLVLCYWLVVCRKKAIIRTVLWQYANSLVKS